MKLFAICYAFVFNICVGYSQAPNAPNYVKTLGTRDWIRLSWAADSINIKGYKIYWSTRNVQPKNANAIIGATKSRFYIKSLNFDTNYYIWISSFNNLGSSKSVKVKGFTKKDWELDNDEIANLSIPSSKAVPEGMKIFWNDEFNDEQLNRNKWSTNYYSNWDFVEKINSLLFKSDSLPQPGLIMTGSTLHLITNDSVPVKPYWSSGRKVSSIQTYDWYRNENLLDNKRGGYYEIRARRKFLKGAQQVNTAYWFDSPGPDLKYFVEDGNTAYGITGIRPHGQVFEIDDFENLNSEIVLHGNVDSKGHFLGNMGQFNVLDEQYYDRWVTHGVLWTAGGLKFYVNGKLKKEWFDDRNIKSPDHFMNVLLGTYGKGGEVDMEVDYIRGYQWPVENGNELANPSFEFKNLFPWTGNALLSPIARRTGNNGLSIEPSRYISQYLYLEPNCEYKLSFYVKGKGTIVANADNITPVSGNVEQGFCLKVKHVKDFELSCLQFKTTSTKSANMKTVRIQFVNESSDNVEIDDISVIKIHK